IENAWVVSNVACGEGISGWAHTYTDAQGLYELQLVPSPGQFFPVVVEEASLDGVMYASQWDGQFYQATLNGTHGPDYTLQPGGTAVGRVVNEAGVGIFDVRIDARLNDRDNRVRLRTNTDSDGYFSLGSLAPGLNYYFLMDPEGQSGISHDGVKYASGETAKAVSVAAGQTIGLDDFVLYEAGMIAGVITDQAGQPVAGVEVALDGRDINGNIAEQSTVSDSFGQYTLDYVAPGTYVLRSDKAGYMTANVTDVPVGRGQQAEHDVVMFNSSQGVVMSGAITNFLTVAGKDAHGVRLPQYDFDYYEYPPFGIAALPMNRTYTEQDLLVLKSLVVGGAGDDEIEDGYGDYFELDANEIPGRYQMTLPPGDIGLFTHFGSNKLGGNAWSAIWDDWRRYDLAAGDIRTNLDFTVGMGGSSVIQGNINVPAGYTQFPEDWCMIYAYALDSQGNITTSNPWGNATAGAGWTQQYEFQHLPPGTYQLRAYARNLASVVIPSVTVTAGETIQDITFRAGGNLTGQVTDETSSIEGATVRIVETGAFATTDANGTYTIVGLNSGTYTAEVSASGHADRQASVVVTSGTSTSQDFALSSTVGSISGTVKNIAGENVNGATVVAYNETDQTRKTGQTVAGVFTIHALTPGSYLLAVDAGSYGIVVHPEGAGRISLAASQDINDIDISVGTPEPPQFTVNSSASDTSPVVLSVEFRSDQDLSANPQVTIEEGSGVLAEFTSNPTRNRFEIQYTADADDDLARLRIQETTPLVSGNPGSKTFSFEVSSNLVSSNSTNVTNALGGTAQMMGAQDNTKVYVPPFAIAGADSKQAVPLVIERYGDPGDAVNGAAGESVTAVYDFRFEETGLNVDQNHTFTVTMRFELPSVMSQQEFTDSLQVRYFDAGDQQWKTDGISNTRINWTNQTILFDVAHLTKFAGFVGEDSAVTVSFTDYMPITSADYGLKTFEWTHGKSGEFISQIGSNVSVPYTSGAISGVEITNMSDYGTLLVANDGTKVRYLGAGDWYISTDTSLTAHPATWTFTDVSDGLTIDQSEYYMVSSDLSTSEKDNTQMLLFEIQDITVPQGHYPSSVVVWYLDKKFPFVAPNFFGKETALGLTFPLSADAAGFSPTAFEILALDVGQIAFGDIAASTGELVDLAMLAETREASTIHPADSDGDFVIGDFELLDYIDQWAQGQVGDFDLLDCIDLWAAGHY
ncbi:MAG: hypothetical protein GY809_09010, partial [Planctomycetes bacterium]|nr:hypothetical protein [Planctomycetota bacterium]